MNPIKKNRIESIDLLKGIVMVIMALEHVRTFFHNTEYYYAATDLTRASLGIFLTRSLSNFCAPAFSLLAGTSAYFTGIKKSKAALSGFLLKRGIWLVCTELIIITFGWYFDPQFRNMELQVIWSLGISMILLSALIYLPKKIIFLFSCILIFGHNLLDNIHFNGSIFWALLHEQHLFNLSKNLSIDVYYPVIPWVGVMSLGYCIGPLYNNIMYPLKRRKYLNIAGIAAIVLFLLLRVLNIYGDPSKWEQGNTGSLTFMSFINLTKYPPSLLFLLFTLGASFIFLANAEYIKGKVVDFFTTFGRVPFFYYIIHIYLIHLLAMITAQLTGYGWQQMICPVWVNSVPGLQGFGFSLPIVYLIWVGIIIVMYPLCKRFDTYKMNNKHKWWLSYL